MDEVQHDFYAGTKDFVNRVINITFEADENRSSDVLSVLAVLPITNDEVNEATEVFAVQLVLTSSVDPDMITITSPAASLCTIADDDREFGADAIYSTCNNTVIILLQQLKLDLNTQVTVLESLIHSSCFS